MGWIPSTTNVLGHDTIPKSGKQQQNWLNFTQKIYLTINLLNFVLCFFLINKIEKSFVNFNQTRFISSLLFYILSTVTWNS